MSQSILAYCISMMVKVLLSSLRIEKVGDQFDRSGVITFLHGEQLPLLIHRPINSPLMAPISLSRDGELQSRVMQYFGIQAARGSTSRGSVRVLRELLNWLRRTDGFVLIAIDGPRGPRGSVAPGAAFLAQKLSLPLWVCRVHCRYAIRLSSWDKFMIPMPFSKVTIITKQCEPSDHLIKELVCV